MAYQATCAEAIQRFDGDIAQYLGAGLLVYFGYPQAHEDDAHRAVRTGLGIANALDMLQITLGVPLMATQYQHRQEALETRERAEAAITLSSEQGFLFWLAWGTILQGWSLAEAGYKTEGIAQLTASHNTGERFYEAALHRLRGELLLQAGVRGLASGVSTPDTAAEAGFQQALAVARSQQAKSLELRATMSLVGCGSTRANGPQPGSC